MAMLEHVPDLTLSVLNKIASYCPPRDVLKIPALFVTDEQTADADGVERLRHA